LTYDSVGNNYNNHCSAPTLCVGQWRINQESDENQVLSISDASFGRFTACDRMEGIDWPYTRSMNLCPYITRITWVHASCVWPGLSPPCGRMP